MYCYHCEGDIEGAAVVIQYEATTQYFCCDPCAYVYVRKINEPKIRNTIFEVKQLAEKIRLKLEHNEMGREEFNKMGITTFKEAISLGLVAQPKLNSVETLKEYVDHQRLEVRMCVLLAKTMELLLERKSKLYVLFKKKVMEAWEELIAQSPNDNLRVTSAKFASYFYDKLKLHEPAFGIV